MNNHNIYYRLIALWVLCEAMLGGIIHGFRIPVTGLIVGSCAVTCISLIAWYHPVRGAILKATVIVAIFKMMLSPHAPFPAYIAVFFQGILAEILFFNRRYFKLSCLLFAPLALVESGLQRILVLTIVYGNDLWRVINDFINNLTKQKLTANYSLLFCFIYVLVHLLTGIVIGTRIGKLPQKISRWKKIPGLRLPLHQAISSPVAKRTNRKKTGRAVLFVTWLLLVVLYLQSYVNPANSILPAHISLRIFIRSLIIVLAWVFLVNPLLTYLLHRWLKKKRSHWSVQVQEVIALLPGLRFILSEGWKKSGERNNLSRLRQFGKIVLTNTVTDHSATDMTEATGKVYILTGPVGSGKTTSLVDWARNTNHVVGILSPVINKRREFLDIETSEQFPMEAAPNEKNTINVGRYRFSEESFQKASAIIRNNIAVSGWLVIDEIGPLEIRGEGFYSVLQEVLGKRKGNTIIIVREGMTELVIEKFDMKEAIVGSVNSFLEHQHYSVK